MNPLASGTGRQEARGLERQMLIAKAFNGLSKRPGARVLLYHGVLPPSLLQGEAGWQDKHVTAPLFRQHMEFLVKAYHPLPLSEIADRLSRGRPLPPNAVAVTFDDGYGNNFELAHPVLCSLGIPATVFVTTGFVDKGEPLWPDRLEYAVARLRPGQFRLPLGPKEAMLETATKAQRCTSASVLRRLLKREPEQVRRGALARLEEMAGARLQDALLQDPALRPLSWPELAEMAGSGLVDVGGHTRTHCILTRCPPEMARQEVTKSRELIRERLGVACDSFAYPNGQQADFNQATRAMLGEAGYSCAVTTVPRLVTAGLDPFEIPRLSIRGSMGVDELKRNLRGWNLLANGMRLGLRRTASRALHRVRG